MTEQNSTIKKSNTLIINIREDEDSKNKIKLNQLLDKIKNNISLILDNQFKNTDVGDVLDYAISSVGKMVRSRLMILFASFSDNFEDYEDEACEMAALVELIHLSSLIHDDIIDDAYYRRNKISVQAKFGKDAAVYAGDYIISKIYFYLAKNSMRLPAMNLAKCIEEMCIGEIGQSRCKYNSNIKISDYIENIKGKTASLFKTSCLLGANFSDFSDNQLKDISEFGINFGILFQIMDDLLDYTSNVKKIGKECNKDFIDGIYTYPIICLIYLEKNNRDLQMILERNKDHNLEKNDFIKLVKLVQKSGAIDLTKKEIERLSNKNLEILNKLNGNNMTRYISESIMNKLKIEQ